MESDPVEKFKRIEMLIAERSSGDMKILDIGCRRQGLKPYLERFGTYHGADLFQTGSVEYVGDFTKGLPIPDGSYDVSVALDVIEHTNDMVVALDEMMRVTRRFAIVILPNHAHWSFRLSFLFSGRLSDKWDVAFPLSEDRHRWLTTATQSNAFMQGYAGKRGYTFERLDSMLGRFGPIVEKTLGRVSANLWDKNQLYVLTRPETGGVTQEARH
jgi:hypothetical protein